MQAPITVPDELTKSQLNLFGNAIEHCALTDYQKSVVRVILRLSVISAQMDWRFELYIDMDSSEQNELLDDYLVQRAKLLLRLEKLRYPYKEWEEMHPYYTDKLDSFEETIQTPFFEEEDLDVCPF